MVKKYNKGSENSYTLGATLTFELLSNNQVDVERVYLHPDVSQEISQKITNICKAKAISYETSTKVFNILSNKENCYVIGQFKKYQSKLNINTNHLVLVNPSDAGNLGTIIRSSLGFGITDIAIIAPATDAFNPKVIRASMGAIFNVKIQYFDSFTEYSNYVGTRHCYPLMLKATTALNEVGKIAQPYSIIFGNEASGLPDEFLNIGTPVIIKHSNKIDSLNLPIAVSITLYEFTKNNRS